ncbi:MAG: hypothetical protein IJD04_05135, partial [Desulfovibrionaceae bacterium]|nr:hypothetical protein [Desulfovibrionaceae bacterium]
MTALLANPALLCMLAALAPTVAFVSVNTRFFTGRQMAQSAGVAAVVGGVLGLLLWLLASHLNAAGVGEGYVSALLGLCTGGIFLVFSERLVTELSKTKKARLIANLSGLTVSALLALLLSPAVLSGLLIVYLGFSLFDLYKKNNPQKELLVYETMGTSEARQSVSTEAPERPFKHKPNVYLFFLESIHSEKAAELIYGIPPDPEMAEFYQKHGFTVYENFFSNNAWTLHSLNSLIENKLNAIISELEYPPYVIRHFLQNGYKLNLFDNYAYAFVRYSKWADYCSFYLPIWIKKLYIFCGALFAQSAILRKVVLGIDLFETGINFDYTYGAVEQKLKKHNDMPVFNIFRFGARHNDYNFYTYKSWEEVYTPLYVRTQAEIKRMTELIVSHDPNAVIIATGDHGAMQYLDVWTNGDVNDNIAKKKLNHDLVARSFFDVLLAVRWPAHVNTPPKIYTHINVFKHLFAILCEDNTILSDIKIDISQKDNFLVADKAKPLERFQNVGAGLLDYDIEEAEKHLDPNDKAGQLQLAQLLLNKNPVRAERIVRGILKQGPYAAAEAMLSNMLFEQNRVAEAKDYYCTKICKTPDADDYLKYAAILKAQGQPEEALALLLGSKKRLGELKP